MAKAIVHIGMNKTGSTFIQDVCAQLRPELAALGICYPVPRDGAINHMWFARAHGFVPRFPATEADSIDAWDAMAQPLPEARETLLLSAEHFSNHRTDAMIGRLKAWLGGHGYDEVRIVVFLRNQVSWLVSAYGQDIKAGGTGTIADFHRRRTSRLVYGNLLSAWARAFGQANVIALNYDAVRQADPQHGILDALWSAIGIAPEARAALVPPRPVRDNAQSPQILLEAIRRGAFGQALLQQGHNFASGMLGRWRAGGPRPVQDARIWPLPPEFLADLATLQQDNAAIAQAFGLPPLPDLHEVARAYQDSVVPVPEPEVARCLSLVKLGATALTGRNARIAGAARMVMPA